MVFQCTVSVVKKQLNAGCSGSFCCPRAADAALEIHRKLELKAFASPSSAGAAPPALPAAELVATAPASADPDTPPSLSSSNAS
jgi:hypothetical protein|eukprot:COSAG02_NODE_65_length_42645_cov_26.951934_16_plen_84_part_00